MLAAIVVCFFLGPVGLGFDWIAFGNINGNLANLALNPLFVIIAIASIMTIITYAVNIYFIAKRLGTRIEQLEHLEKTMYKGSS